jgi:hypothetical protein
MKKLLSIAVIVPVILATSPLGLAQDKTQGQDQAQPPPQYTPQAVFCAETTVPNALCSVLPSYIAPDPRLKSAPGYDGLRGDPPMDIAGDVETPFDNMAWQMFVALNWAKDVSGKAPAQQGLAGQGLRVWQAYPKVAALFGNSPVRAGCTNALAIPTFYIGSDGKGKPAPNNEEYFQASTNLPLVDINGNWTIFERRVNDVEAKFLRAPEGNASQTLTTVKGQKQFVANHQPNPDVQFTASATVMNGAVGSIEIKVAWRIIDREAGDDPSRYYTMPAQIAVAGDLVQGGKPFCRSALMGLVGMHIIQRNPFLKDNSALHKEWIWATFEHVDNAPDAQAPCSVRDGCGASDPSRWINQPSCGAAAPKTMRYSYFNQNAPVQDTNIRPKAPGSDPKKYPWNSRPPYAQGGTTPATMLPQATRCWSIYPTTHQLNLQWQKALGDAGSVFRHYKLVGTQWGALLETLPPPPPPARPNPVPINAVPGMLSNLTLETYIQNYNGTDTDKDAPGPGSCVACHNFAPLVATNGKDKNGQDKTVKSDFSFLPLLAKPETARSVIQTAKP